MHNIYAISAGKVDMEVSAAALLAEFGIANKWIEPFYDCMTHVECERFNVPYAEGEPLTLKRAFGAEVREALSGDTLTSEVLETADPTGCPYIPMLELFDRFGCKSAMSILFRLQGPFAEDVVKLDAPQRQDALGHDDILFLARELIAEMFCQMTGAKPSRRRDFKKKKGAMAVVPFRMADFIQKAMAIAGWNVSAKQIARAYQFILCDPNDGVQQLVKSIHLHLKPR